VRGSASASAVLLAGLVACPGLPRKPIRIFLQGGAHDLDNAWGNWPLANQEMAAALAFAGYEHQFVYGRGFHSERHGRALLPDSLRWLWRP